MCGFTSERQLIVRGYRLLHRLRPRTGKIDAVHDDYRLGFAAAVAIGPGVHLQTAGDNDRRGFDKIVLDRFTRVPESRAVEKVDRIRFSVTRLEISLNSQGERGNGGVTVYGGFRVSSQPPLHCDLIQHFESSFLPVSGCLFLFGIAADISGVSVKLARQVFDQTVGYLTQMVIVMQFTFT